MHAKPKIFIVDDHTLFREGIKLIIQHEDLGEVIGEAENGKDFLDQIHSLSPDLILMDIQMPVMNGLEATKKALIRWPKMKILVISMYAEKEKYSAMIEAGVMGFVLKSASKNEFTTAIKTIMKGDNYFSNELLKKIVINMKQDVAHSVAVQNEKSIFTERELQVLQGFCQGYTPREIADNLLLNIKTIEAHRSKLLYKTKSKNTINLVLYTIKNKIIEI